MNRNKCPKRGVLGGMKMFGVCLAAFELSVIKIRTAAFCLDLFDEPGPHRMHPCMHYSRVVLCHACLRIPTGGFGGVKGTTDSCTSLIYLKYRDNFKCTSKSCCRDIMCKTALRHSEACSATELAVGNE